MHGSMNIKVNKHRGQNASRKKNIVTNVTFEKRKAAISVHETVRKLKILIKLNTFEQITVFFDR
jgi:hypothetical protein